jgi:hypothetical protein
VVSHEGQVWPPPGYQPGVSSNSPQGGGVYGKFYGIESDGMEAGEIFEPVNFSGMCALELLSFLLTLDEVKDDRQHTTPNF